MSSDYEEILHRDLLETARRIGDGESVHTIQAHQIGQRLRAILLRQDPMADYDPLRKQVRKILPALATTEVGREIAAALNVAFLTSNSDTREELAEVLGDFGQATPEVLNLLVEVLQDDSCVYRYYAEVALEELGRSTPEALTTLIGAVKHHYARIRENPYRVFDTSVPEQDTNRASTAQATPKVLAALSEALHDTDDMVRVYAAWALLRLRKATSEAHRVLIETMYDGSFLARRKAARALGEWGPSPEVIAALVSGTRDKDHWVRWDSAKALATLGQALPEVLAALIVATKDIDECVRQRATLSVGRLGIVTPEVLSALHKVSHDTDQIVRTSTAWALNQLGQVTREVLSATLAALQAKDGDVRAGAACALGLLGQATPEVLVGLFSAIQDKEAWVRANVARAFGQLGAATPEVLSALLNAMQDADDWVLHFASEALGLLGQATPEVLAALLKATQHQENWVRDGAWQGLWDLV